MEILLSLCDTVLGFISALMGKFLLIALQVVRSLRNTKIPAFKEMSANLLFMRLLSIFF